MNDDYCDCPDGSDEPGTSACSFLSTLSPPQLLPGSTTGTTNITKEALALPGFFCKNKGHRPGYVASERVNDGVCDYEECCDGSEEYAHVGGIKCENRCVEMGKEYKRKEEERAKGKMEAIRRRRELVKEAERARLQLEDSVKDLETQVGGLRVREEEARKQLDEVERREKYRVISGGSAKATRTTVLAKLAKARVEELRTALQKEVEKKATAAKKLAELEGILTAFKTEYNPNFNDEGVKRAVKAWEDYVAASPPGDTLINADPDVEVVLRGDSEETSGINWEEWEKEEEESDVEVLYKFEEYLPESLRLWLHSKITDVRRFMVENGILADNNTASGAESRAVISAREAFNDVKKQRESMESNIQTKRNDLSKDYGPNEVFRALKDQCTSIEAGEYKYELCWMGHTTQISLKSQSHTSLGDFRRLEKVFVDEEEGVDGRGLGRGERWQMVFEDGQQCWNGPRRSTVVVMRCKEREEVWRVVEAEKCVYRMEVGTPAVCDDNSTGNGNQQQVVVKDEL